MQQEYFAGNLPCMEDNVQLEEINFHQTCLLFILLQCIFIESALNRNIYEQNIQEYKYMLQISADPSSYYSLINIKPLDLKCCAPFYTDFNGRKKLFCIEQKSTEMFFPTNSIFSIYDYFGLSYRISVVATTKNLPIFQHLEIVLFTDFMHFIVQQERLAYQSKGSGVNSQVTP